MAEDLTVKNLTVESLTIKHPDGKGTITALISGRTLLLSLNSGDEQESIALVVERGVGPYLQIRTRDTPKGGLPTAFTADYVQMSTPDQRQVTIPLNMLVDAIRLMEPKPQ